MEVAILLFYRRIFLTKTNKWCVDIMFLFSYAGPYLGLPLVKPHEISIPVLCEVQADPQSHSRPKYLPRIRFDSAGSDKFRYNYWNYVLVVSSTSTTSEATVMCFLSPVIRTTANANLAQNRFCRVFFFLARCVVRVRLCTPVSVLVLNADADTTRTATVQARQCAFTLCTNRYRRRK